jgi:hypothetical protein
LGAGALPPNPLAMANFGMDNDLPVHAQAARRGWLLGPIRSNVLAAVARRGMIEVFSALKSTSISRGLGK